MTADILQQAIRARTFIGTVAGGAGITVPIYNTTTFTFGLWNPANTQRLIVPIQLSLGIEATGTAAVAEFGFSQVLTTGGSAATAAPIATWTDATVYNGRIGKTGGNVGRIGNGTLTAAGTYFYGTGIGLSTTTLVGGPVTNDHWFNDSLILEPGTMIHLVGNIVAPGSPVTPMLSWYELDYLA
jgi:hypothetical protein